MRQVLASRHVMQAPPSGALTIGMEDQGALTRNPFARMATLPSSGVVPAPTPVQKEPMANPIVPQPEPTRPGIDARQVPMAPPVRQAPQAQEQPSIPTPPTMAEMTGQPSTIDPNADHGTFNDMWNERVGDWGTTDFGGVKGQGPTPIHRFVDAAIQSTGQKVDLTDSMGGFVNALQGIPINAQNWDRMMENTPPSPNIEDRRGEKSWANTDMREWTPEMWKDYNQALHESNLSKLDMPSEMAQGGEVIPMEDTFRNMQQSNAMSRALSRGEQESKPKAPIVPLRPLGK